jgi:hypothetical protein
MVRQPSLMKKLLTVVLIALAPFIGLVGVWLFTLLYDPAPAQDNCAFGSVSKSDFQRMLAKAKRQDWAVWPGLSNGIFWPSVHTQAVTVMPPVDKVTNAKLLSFISRLTSKSPSTNERLAAIHALMRSMHAEYTSVSEIPDLAQHGKVLSSKVYFTYLLPQIRFAPLCVFCFLFWNTSIGFVFDHTIATDTYRLDHAGILHSGFKSDPNYEHHPKACPSFPRFARK